MQDRSLRLSTRGNLRTHNCNSGALKSNIGHLEGASGIAGLIKTVLVLEKGIIPPNTNFEKLNPRIRADLLNLEFPTESILWPAEGLRRASVNSFGFGGSNAHAVLDDAQSVLVAYGLQAHHSTSVSLKVTSSSNGAVAARSVDRSNGPNGVNGTTSGMNGHSNLPHINGSANGSTNGSVNGHTNGHVNGNGNRNGHNISHSKKGAPKLLMWSAADKESVSRIVSDYANFHSEHASSVSEDPDYLHHLSYTLSLRRTRHAWRSFAVVQSADRLGDLAQLATTPIRVGKEGGIIFAFTGQGAQYAGMGRDLLQWPVFRETLMEFNAVLEKLGCEWTVLGGYFPTIWSKIHELLLRDHRIRRHRRWRQNWRTRTEPALVYCGSNRFGGAPAYLWNLAYCCCWTFVWRNSSCVSVSLLHHTLVPELTANRYTMGAITLSSAVRISYHRGRAAGRLYRSSSCGFNGSMLAVGRGEDEIRPYLSSFDQLSVACINSPCSVTIAGDKKQIIALKAQLDSVSIFCRELNTGVAYHSIQMEEVAAEYRASIQNLDPGHNPRHSVSMVSSVTGETVASATDLCDSDYWVRNMVSPVQFSQALSKLVSRPKTRRKLGQKSHLDFHDIVEVGPHSALQRPIEEVLKGAKRQMQYTTSLSRFAPASEQVENLAGRLFCSGHPVQLDKVNRIDITQPQQNRHLVRLPQYSFSRAHRHWEESKLSVSLRLRQHFPRTLLGAPVPDWNPLEAKWRRYLSHKHQPWLLDHRIDGSLVLPATGMLAMALEAAHQTADPEQAIKGYWIKEANFFNAIVLPTDEEESAEIETFLRPSATGSTLSDVRICVKAGDQWTDACRVSVQVQYASSRWDNNDADEAALRAKSTIERHALIASQCSKAVDHDTLYETYDKMGLGYGPMFRNLTNTKWNGSNAAVSDVRLISRKPATVENEADTFLVHPGTLDAIVHLSFVPLTHGGAQLFKTAVPTRVRDAWIANVDTRDDGMNTCWRATATSSCNGFKKIEGDFTVMDQHGNAIISIAKLESSTVVRDEEEMSMAKRLCFGLNVQPDVGMLDPSMLTLLDVKSFMKLMAHKHPALNILEVNAGHGEVTTAALAGVSQLRTGGVKSFSRYLAIERDTEATEKARESIRQMTIANQVEFLSLNFSKDPLEQGLQAESFDVAILPSSSCTEGLRDIYRANASKLLTATGLLVEVRGEQIVSVNQKHRAPTPALSDKVLVLVKSGAETDQKLAEELQSILIKRGCPSCEIVPLHTLKTRGDVDEHRFICLAETNGSLLGNLNERAYSNLKFVLSRGNGMLWVTQSRNTASSWPDTQMVTGLARVLRSEDPNRPFVTLSLEDEVDNLEMMAQYIQEISTKCDSSAFDPHTSEAEYVLRDGTIHIRRVTESSGLDQYIHDRTHAQHEQGAISEAGPLALGFGTPGVVDSLRFVPDKSHAQPLGPQEVELEVRAVGLNFKDLLTALGKVEDDRFGVECSGIVTRVGIDCPSDIHPGDHVFALNIGCMKTHVRCHAQTVFKMPSDMSFEYAAAFPAVGVTAYYGLIEMARLERGESVLIHAGAGGTGQFCIQIAQAVGAEVYATVSSGEKRELLTSRYGIPDDHIFYSRNTSFAEAAKRATNGRGVDVLVNSLGGDSLVASWEIMAPFGRFVELGKADIIANNGLPMQAFAKNVSFIAVNIDFAVDHKPRLIQRMMGSLLQMMRDHELTVPHPLQAYSFARAEDAFRHMQSGKSMGKIVLTCQPTDVVQVSVIPHKDHS
jgi:acyl transferase domain-containing protein/NADPH:quinone reductase-like Zn-dependent oxidoreductase